jgi:tRNA 2-selenouridine synthase
MRLSFVPNYRIMQRVLSVNEALAKQADCVVLDVRSEGEYERGHIPGAISFPLFNNEERAEVGTLYKQIGKDAAYLRGLEIVGPKMAYFVRQAMQLNPAGKEIILHCWRGGQRSKSLAWLLASAGMQVNTIQGGYKAYRQVTQEYLAEMRHQLIVLGGSTGSGKTVILQELRNLGEQVIDLEALARHKGSAFGWLGEKEQPHTEHFENLLADELQKLDVNKRIWVENESKSIGRVFLPLRFRLKMKETALFQYELDLESRLDILVEGYAKFAEGELIHSFERIKTKLGGLAFQQAVVAVKSGDFRSAARIALVYYDKTYGHSLELNETPKLISLQSNKFDAKRAAIDLIGLANEHLPN